MWTAAGQAPLWWNTLEKVHAVCKRLLTDLGNRPGRAAYQMNWHNTRALCGPISVQITTRAETLLVKARQGRFVTRFNSTISGRWRVH